MTRSIVLLVIATLSGCAGCGRTVELDALDQELPPAICDKVFECCSAAEIRDSEAVSFEDEAGCLTTYQASVVAFFVPSLEDAEQAGRAEYDPRAAARCIDRMPRSSCDEFAEQFTGGVICDEMIEPLVPVGERCSVNFECVEGTCVIDDFEADEGTCRNLPTPGDECFERERPDETVDELCVAGASCVEGTCQTADAPAADGCGLL